MVRGLIYILMAMLPLSVFSQNNVRNAVKKVEEASDLTMEVTNVVKRDPSTHQVMYKVMAVDNLAPRNIREVAKALEKDLNKADESRTEQVNGTVTNYVSFKTDKSVLRVILLYGPLGGKLVVREDFIKSAKPRKMEYQLPPEFDLVGLELWI